MTDSDKDELLLEKARTGNQDAFLMLYQRHRSPIFRFLYRLLGSTESAEAIAHDCFLSLIRNSERSSSAAVSLRTRLYSSARTRAMEYLENAGQEEPTPRRNKPDDEAQSGELVSEVAEGVASLSPLEREALILSEYEGLKLDEIAAIVDADVRTVAGRIESARKRLRNALSNHLYS